MSKGTIQLTTDRLTLRRHIIEDAEILHQNFGLDPETGHAVYRTVGYCHGNELDVSV